MKEGELLAPRLAAYNMKLKNTTTGEIEKIIKELKSKRSCGYD